MRRPGGECSRPNCDRIVDRRGLCKPHYDKAYPLQGYTNPEKARQHIQALRDRGVTLNMLEDMGVTRSVVARLNRGEQTIYRMTEATILAIPLPDAVVSSPADIPAVGTIRRIRALAALGWPQQVLAARLGWSQSMLANRLARDKVRAETAAAVSALFKELQLMVGPSQLSRDRALRKGWAPPLAWDDIDDPDERPNTGETTVYRFTDKVRELRELGVTNEERLAERLGMTTKSLDRQLWRYGIHNEAAS